MNDNRIDEEFRINDVLLNLKELADKDMQRRLWLACPGPGDTTTEISSFEEAVCGLFDDTGLGDIVEGKRTNELFSVPILNSLRRLDKLVVCFDEREMSEEMVIEDPRMEEIRSAAAEVLSLLKQKGIE